MKRLQLACCLSLLSACTGTSSEPAQDTAPAAPSVTTPSAAKEPTAEQVPVAADFAEEAHAAIQPASYKAELAALAREIESDSE
jgi:hypothetical protein